MRFDRAGLAEAVAGRGAVARVAVAGTQGSAPREAGAAMLVWAAGQAGTIGGGAVEWQAAAAARALLARGGPRRVDRLPLRPALGQCCGRAVTLVTEVWDAGAPAALPAGPPVARPLAEGAARPLAVRRLVARVRA